MLDAKGPFCDNVIKNPARCTHQLPLRVKVSLVVKEFVKKSCDPTFFFLPFLLSCSLKVAVIPSCLVISMNLFHLVKKQKMPLKLPKLVISLFHISRISVV